MTNLLTIDVPGDPKYPQKKGVAVALVVTAFRTVVPDWQSPFALN